MRTRTVRKKEEEEEVMMVVVAAAVEDVKKDDMWNERVDRLLVSSYSRPAGETETSATVFTPAVYTTSV